MLAIDIAYTVALIFGGCCSNALTLEDITRDYPGSGALLTFAQFLIVAVVALPSHLTLQASEGSTGLARLPFPRLKPRQISLAPYTIQVAIYYGLSRLNNAAFAYNIPMTVHIIFRSGGLVVSLLLGWILLKRRYNMMQVLSVAVVTIGVILSTLAASPSASKSSQTKSTASTASYVQGIGILSVALVLGGLIGIVQDRTFSAYRERMATLSKDTGAQVKIQNPWKEAMFYLHFLSLPLFIPSLPTLRKQFEALSRSPLRPLPIIPLPKNLGSLLLGALPKHAEPYLLVTSSSLTLRVPSALALLAANVATQLVCSSGVNRFTAQVSSLSVTLTLVVRKAVSLMLSVYLNGGSGGTQMWTGAALVLIGTVAYTMASAKPQNAKVKQE